MKFYHISMGVCPICKQNKLIPFFSKDKVKPTCACNSDKEHLSFDELVDIEVDKLSLEYAEANLSEVCIKFIACAAAVGVSFTREDKEVTVRLLTKCVAFCYILLEDASDDE